MRTLALVLTLASAAGLAGCHRADCVSTCEARDKVLKCGQTNCKILCEKLHTHPTCGPELKGFEVCLLKQPVDKWECDDSHEPALKDGVCSPERAAVMKCLEAGPPPSMVPPAAAPPAKP